MTSKKKKEKVEQINEKFRSLLEPYADQLRNTGLIVEWFPDEDYPDCSSFSCCLSKNDMDEGDEFISVCLNAPEMDWEHPELYDLDKYTPIIYFNLESKIHEIKVTSITKKELKSKLRINLATVKNTKKRIFKLSLNGRNMLYRK